MVGKVSPVGSQVNVANSTGQTISVFNKDFVDEAVSNFIESQWIDGVTSIGATQNKQTNEYAISVTATDTANALLPDEWTYKNTKVKVEKRKSGGGAVPL